MHCVYTAYCNHLFYLKTYPKDDSYAYETIKRITHDGTLNIFTHVSVVPYLITVMARRHDLSVRIERTEWCACDVYDNEIQKYVISVSDYGVLVSEITLEPAIYLLFDAHHAVFSETVPKTGFPVMALRLEK